MRASLALFGSALTACALGCAGSPTAPVAPPGSPTPIALPQVADGHGMATGVIGLHEITIDPVALTAEIGASRAAAAQGDLALLSIRPFLGADDVKPLRVSRDPSGSIILTVQFRHPFLAPADLTPPGSPAKRIDLHAFDVNALVVSDGTDSFFATTDDVTTNANLLLNADGYRKPGPTFDAAALGIATADSFPYKLVAKNIDTADPLGTYDPLANGWTGNDLLDPEGYDVFNQGLEVEVEFELNLGTTPVTIQLVTLAKYLQPKATDPTKSNRLPVPGDPTALQYILPEAAGDVQRIATTVTGNLVGGSAAEFATIDVEVLDWDHGAIVAGTFPNNANLGEVSEPSDVFEVEADFPDLRATGTFTGTAPTGAAPLIDSQSTVNNVDLFDPPTSTEVLGLIRVTDEQDDDDFSDPTKPAVLGEGSTTPIPGATLSSTRYQVVRVTVDPGSSVQCLGYGPGLPQAWVGIPWNLDLDSVSPPAFHPDGIVQYRIDYNNDTTFDAVSIGPGQETGPGRGDFSLSHTYVAPGPQTIQVELTTGAPSNLVEVCPLTVTVVPAPVIVLDPLPASAINPDQGSDPAHGGGQAERFRRQMVNIAPGVVLWSHWKSTAGTAPVGVHFYISNNSGSTWSPNTPNYHMNQVAGGAAVFSSNGYALGVLANSSPCVALVDTANAVAFASAQTNTATGFNQLGGGTLRGTVIVSSGVFVQPDVMPSRTDPDLVFVLVRNQAGFGTIPNGIGIYKTINATAAAPTFALVGGGAVDTTPASAEGVAMAAVDINNNVHVVYDAGGGAADFIAYRRYNNTTDTFTAAPLDISTTVTFPLTTNVTDPFIVTNALGDPVVTWTCASGIVTDPISWVQLAVKNPYGWSTPANVNQASASISSNRMGRSAIVIDDNDFNHVAYLDERIANSIPAPYVSLWSPDGSTKVGLDFQLRTSGPGFNDKFENVYLLYDPTGDKYTAVAYTAIGATFGSSGRMLYRTYTCN